VRFNLCERSLHLSARATISQTSAGVNSIRETVMSNLLRTPSTPTSAVHMKKTKTTPYKTVRINDIRHAIRSERALCNERVPRTTPGIELMFVHAEGSVRSLRRSTSTTYCADPIRARVLKSTTLSHSLFDAPSTHLTSVFRFHHTASDPHWPGHLQRHAHQRQCTT